MSTISVTVIGYNDAHLLPNALESVSWADEIVFVDCGSSDDSLTVARRYTDRVFEQPNRTNLNVNKSYAIEQAGREWVLYLDPDEAIPPALAEEIRGVISSNPRENAFRLPRRNHFFGRWLRHGGQYPDLQLRLFRRGKAHFPCVDVHESLQVEGSVGRLREAMEHYTCPTTFESLRKMDFYSTFHGELMVKQGMRPSIAMALSYMLFKPVGKFLRRYFLKGGFLDGWPGFLQASISSIDFQFRFIKFWQVKAQSVQDTAQSGARH
ncbi:MAG: glycosyltransferase family 2 protein [SAR324 cluster bacterium]|nr:glycosyltransferase family 2 protein [SAR324 cluster bacterium]